MFEKFHIIQQSLTVDCEMAMSYNDFHTNENKINV